MQVCFVLLGYLTTADLHESVVVPKFALELELSLVNRSLFLVTRNFPSDEDRGAHSSGLCTFLMTSI